MMLAVLLAEMLPRFDLVMGLLGGLFTGPLTFIIPPLLYSKLRSMLPDRGVETRSDTTINQFLKRHFFTLEVNLNEGGLGKLEKIVVWVIVFVGVTATFSAVYFSLRGVVWTSKFVPPCIVDVKAAASVIV